MANRIVLFLQFLLLCAVVFLKLRNNAAYFLTPDSHYYLRAAQNLLDGRGYLIVFEGKETFCAIWPIGYPALIAAVAWLTSLSVETASKVVNLLALAGCFWLIYQRFQDKAWFVAMAFSASSLIQLYTNTWSETVFLFFILGFCTVSTGAKSGVLWAIGAFLTRYAGIFLLLPLFVMAVGYQRSAVGGRRSANSYWITAICYLLFVVCYLMYNYSQTQTFTGGHGFWPNEPFFERLGKGAKGIGEELLFFAIRDWDLKNTTLSNLMKWFIYGIAALQVLIGALVVWRVGWLLKDKDASFVGMTKNKLLLTGICYLLFTVVVYLIDASIESLYFRRLAPSSLLFTLALLGWVAHQKEIFKRTQWLFVAFFVLSIIHAIPKRMSSHHVVREKQEPALLIANGEGCSDELMGQLLEWSPFVVVLDHAIHRVLDLGIKVDVLLGDFDRNVDFQEILSRQYPLEIVSAPNQDKTDLEKGIEFLIERGFPAVNILWATGRRADHSISNMTNIVRYKNQIKTVMFDDYSKVFPLVGTFEKWYAAGTPISLIPIGMVEQITTEGLKYNLQNDFLKLGYRSGNSNEAATDGFVKISAQVGDLLIMECWD